MTEPTPPRTPSPPDDFDGTLRQSDEAVGKTRDLSIPTGVEQQASAPRIAGYVLTAMLGQGAYAQVWRAWQVRTRKWVAVKCFLARGGVNWMLLQREMERLIRLDKHPHIVSLLDADLTADPAWYALDLLEAGSLEQYVDPGKLTGVEQAAKWMEEIAEALSYVHSKGIIHCDLKPANVLLDDMGHARVADFGQSRILSDSAGALGTLFYMAPEQAMLSQGGQAVQPDVRWDVYALGASAYAVLTGKVPNHESLKERLTASAGLEERLNAYRELTRGAVLPTARAVRGPVVDEDLSAIVAKCLAYEPNERYGTMDAVVADLAARRESRPVSPLAASRRYRTRKFLRRNRVLVAVVALAALGLGGAFVKIAWDGHVKNESLALAYAIQGRNLVEKGDIAAGIGHYVESYRLSPSPLARDNVFAYLPGISTPRFIIDEYVGWQRIRLSPDGKVVMTADWERGIAKFWSPDDGSPVGPGVSSGGTSFRDACFTSDGAYLLTLGGQGEVRAWDWRKGEAAGDPEVVGTTADRIVMTPAGNEFLVRMWNQSSLASEWHCYALDGRKPVAKWTVSPSTAPCEAMFSPSGKAILFGCWSFEVRRSSDGGLVRKWETGGAGVGAMAFSPDETLVAAGCQDGSVWLAGVGAGSPGKVAQHGQNVVEVAFSPDGKRLMSASWDRYIRFWDVAAGRPANKGIVLDMPVKSAAYSPDGSLVAAGSNDFTARVWSTSALAQVGNAMVHDNQVEYVTFCKDGNGLITVGNDSTVRVWDAGSRKPAESPREVVGRAIAISPDGGRFLTVDGRVMAVWDTVKCRLAGRTMVSPDGVALAAWSSDGKSVISCGGSACRVARLWDVESGRQRGKLLWHDAGITGLAFSPRDDKVATICEDGTARLWDARSGDPIGEAMLHAGYASLVAFSPDGARLLTGAGRDGGGVGGNGRTARLWDASNGRPLGRAMWHKWAAAAAAISPDGRRLVTSSWDSFLYFWDGRTGEPAGRPVAESRGSWIIRFSPAGDRFVNVCNGRARLRHARDGSPIGKPIRHDGDILCVAFSRDGSYLLTGGGDRTARLWDTSTGEPLGPSLGCSGKATIVAFNPEGDVVICCDDGTTQVRKIPWLGRRETAETLRLKFEVASRRRLDRSGSLEIVPIGEWRRLKARLARIERRR